VEYFIPQAGNVRLKIYDSLGKEVATLVNDFQQAGNHKINFNTANLPSGIYMYRIESGSFKSTKKMVLLK
jgi:hypothetical protein